MGRTKMTDSPTPTRDPVAVETVNANGRTHLSLDELLRVTEPALEESRDAVYWVDEAGSVVYANEAAAANLGYDRRALLTVRLPDIEPQYDADAWEEEWSQVRGHATLRIESHQRTFDGRLIPVEVSVSLIELGGRDYMCRFVHDLRGRDAMREQVRRLNEEIDKRVADRTAALLEEIAGREKIEAALLDETDKIQNILDNAGQGFLTFGSDLRVDLECSEECRVLFDGEIWGRPFPELLFQDNDQQRTFLGSLLRDVYSERDEERRELFFSLLPDEVSLPNGRTVHVDYRQLATLDSGDARLMVILTDITETKRLQSQVESERNRLKMVVKAVTNTGELRDAIDTYRHFCSVGLSDLLSGHRPVIEALNEIFRQVHTFKGTFAQLDIVYTVERLHELESELSLLRAGGSPPPVARIAEWLDELDPASWLETDLAALRGALGSEYLERRETLDVSAEDIQAIERQMVDLLSPAENRQLLPLLRRLRCRSFRHLLRRHVDYVAALAERKGKRLKPLVVEGEDMMVDPNRFRGFARVLVHVFRNAVDHGIENEDERTEAGKDPAGRIDCMVEKQGGWLVLTIRDDGAGVDIDALKARAATAGLHSAEELSDMSDKEALHLIFEDGLSTQDEVNDTSGRGVGLAAVNSELAALSGRVEVESAPGQGTTLRFTIPLGESIELPRIEATRFLSRVVTRARDFIAHDMGVDLDVEQANEAVKAEKIRLYEVTALIGLRGSLTGTFAMSFDQNLARALVQRFAMDDLSDDEIETYVDDTMAEIANTVLGNSLNVLPELGGLMTIGTPSTIKRSGGSTLGFAGAEMWSTETMTEAGDFSVSLLISESA